MGIRERRKRRRRLLSGNNYNNGKDSGSNNTLTNDNQEAESSGNNNRLTRSLSQLIRRRFRKPSLSNNSAIHAGEETATDNPRISGEIDSSDLSSNRNHCGTILGTMANASFPDNSSGQSSVPQDDPDLSPVPSTSKGYSGDSGGFEEGNATEDLEHVPSASSGSGPAFPRRENSKKRKSGLATVSIRPVVAFDLVEEGHQRDDEREQERREDHVNNNSIPNGDDIQNINESSRSAYRRSILTLEQVRRMSDHTFQKFIGRLRRSSDVVVRTDEGEADERAREDFKAAAARKMSVDSSGILKRPSLDTKLPRIRKAVSFSQQDNIRVFESCEEKTQEDSWGGQPEEGEEDPQDGGRSLIPTFVYPGKKPNYRADFAQSVLKLESMVITADFSLIGSVRVNLTALKGLQTPEERSTGQRLSVGVTYSTDQWISKQETPAMLVKTFAHPQLTGLETQCLRFVIDCETLEVGETIELTLWCVDKSKPERVLYEDDNGKLLYKISCTQRLSSPWAMLAAKQLNTFAPVVKFNKNYF